MRNQPIENNHFFYTKFYPSLQQHFKSDRTALLIAKLEYWFSKDKFKEGFFKFLEPCSHRLCKEGDTWAEELGWKRDLFKRTFDKIGIRYISKTSYKEALQKGALFQGNLYACYYDRKTNRTFFIRNHNIADSFFQKLMSSLSDRKHKREITLRTSPSHSSLSAQYSNKQKAQSFIFTNKNTYNSSIQKSSLQSKDNRIKNQNDKRKKEENVVNLLLKIWKQKVGPLSQWVYEKNFLVKLKYAFTNLFEGSIEKWQAYCQKISSSKFLMGEGGSSFKAWIQWAIKPEAVKRILEGGFTLGDRENLRSCEELHLRRELENRLQIKKDLERDLETVISDVERERREAVRKKGKNPDEYLDPETLKSYKHEFTLKLRQENTSFAKEFQQHDWKTPRANFFFMLFLADNLATKKLGKEAEQMIKEKKRELQEKIDNITVSCQKLLSQLRVYQASMLASNSDELEISY